MIGARVMVRGLLFIKLWPFDVAGVVGGKISGFSNSAMMAFLTRLARSRARAFSIVHQSGALGRWSKMHSIRRMIRGLL